MPDHETRITVHLTPGEADALAKAAVVVTSAADRAFVRSAERALDKCKQAAKKVRIS